LLIIVGLALAHLLIQPANTPDPPATADNHRPKAIPLVTARSLPIAVLPLVSHGDATDSEYFADGLTEDIISALGRFSELSVRSRGAVLPYKGKTPSPAQVGRELGVRYVLEGSIRRNGDRIRVSVQLADIEHAASVLWSEHFDASLQDIFAVQDEITRRIAGSLAVRLGGLELARMATKPPSRLEAYDFVLRGRDFLARTTRTANAQARALFERAISLDPHYVPALVGLGLVDVNAVRFGWTADPDEALERAERLGRKALAIDEATPSAHALLGRIHIRRGDLERALDAMRRALALNPSDADSYAGLGNALLLLGDVDGAIAAIETAAQLHPQMPVTDHFRLSMAYILAERSAEAIRTLEHALERNDGNVFLAAMLAAAYAAAGRQEDAARQSLAVRRLSPLFASDEIGSLFRNPAHREKIRAALRKAGL
jgi:TolB-like protein